MTDSDSASDTTLVKTDVLGRTRTTKEQREAILDAFDKSGLSGPDFARVHGINYQTFATWRQKRRREQGAYPKAPAASKAASKPLEAFTLIEATVESPQQGDALTLEIGKEARLVITDSSQIPFAVELLKHWQGYSAC